MKCNVVLVIAASLVFCGGAFGQLNCFLDEEQVQAGFSVVRKPIEILNTTSMPITVDWFLNQLSGDPIGFSPDSGTITIPPMSLIPAGMEPCITINCMGLPAGATSQMELRVVGGGADKTCTAEWRCGPIGFENQLRCRILSLDVAPNQTVPCFGKIINRTSMSWSNVDVQLEMFNGFTVTPQFVWADQNLNASTTTTFNFDVTCIIMGAQAQPRFRLDNNGLIIPGLSFNPNCGATWSCNECLLLLSPLTAWTTIPGDGDVLLVDYIADLSWGITLSQRPLIPIPDASGLLGVHLYAQVVMYNPVAFPNNPIQMSNGLDIEFGVGTTTYGPTSGMFLWAHQPPLLGTDLDLRFVFSNP